MPEPCPDCGSKEGAEHTCAGPARGLVGRVLDGRYEIESVLGRGGMGTVYRARQTSVKRPVAIKTLHPSLAAAPEFFERFRREAEIASRLHHPHIITIYDFGRAPEGTCYFVMELLEGQSVKERVKGSGPMSLRRVVNLAEQAARALGYAHREGVVHRDIKPHNLMLQEMDGADFVKILDFGLVKALEQEESEQLTSTGQVLGTPQYMSPEQAGGEEVDARSDLYALTGVLYFCLTGASPFGANTVRRALKAALTEEVPKVGARRDGAPVPPALDAFFVKGLAGEKADRFQDADELVRAFKAALADVPEAALDARPHRPATPPSQSKAGSSSDDLQPTGAQIGRPGEPAVIVDSRVARSRTSVPPRRIRPAQVLIFSGVVAFGLGLGAYRLRHALKPPPPVAPAQAILTPAPAPAPTLVEVSLRSTPPGADIFEGMTQIGTTPVQLNLPKEGLHALSFRLHGYRPSERTLDLSRLSQDRTEVEVTLDPLVAPETAKKPKRPTEIPVFE
jgi:serine/threonine protein kinase